MEDHARTTADLDPGRNLGTHPRPRDRQGRLRRHGGVDRHHRLQQRPGPPALRRGPEKGGCTTAWVETLAVDGEALGRSRGGLTSKIHLAVDGRGLPMSIILTPGQAGDNPQLLPLLDQITVGRDGPGRPRVRPDRVLADKAYSHPSTRAALRRRGIAFTSPEKSDQTARRATKGQPGRAFTDLRPVALRRPQRHRALRQPAQAVPRPGHPLPQASVPPPLRDRHRGHRVVAAHSLTEHALVGCVTLLNMLKARAAAAIELYHQLVTADKFDELEQLLRTGAVADGA